MTILSNLAGDQTKGFATRQGRMPKSLISAIFISGLMLLSGGAVEAAGKHHKPSEGTCARRSEYSYCYAYSINTYVTAARTLAGRPFTAIQT